jgi:uncharacterized protein
VNEDLEFAQRVAPDDLSVRDTNEGRIIFGTVVPYGQIAEVNDGFGPYRESFAFGAFARSIAQRADKVKLFSVHNGHVKLPIGRSVMFEERKVGLYGEFLVSRTADGEDALTLVKDGAVDAFSVGFKPMAHRKDRGVTVRTEAALREVSLVGLPAYEGAQLAGVRSDLPPDVREFLDRYVTDLLALADPGTGTPTPPDPGHGTGAVRAAQLRGLDLITERIRNGSQ